MKISIVTPVYNGEKFIDQTIQSILAQKFRNFQHIVMDGLSEDNTLEIVKKYSNINLVSQKDSGQTNALNEGFKLVDGDILAWQNGDDLYFPDTFQIVNDFFESNPTVDLVYGNYQLINEKDNLICNVSPPHWNKWLFIHGRFCPVQPTVFWRKEVFEAVKPLDEKLFFCMDVDFYSRAIKLGFKFEKINQLLGKFRVHDESKTQNKLNVKKHFKEYNDVLSKRFDYKISDFLFFYFFTLRASITSKLSKIGPGY
ncbi:MAG: glycosyltransferase family 2 protein [Cytophagales bacterium]